MIDAEGNCSPANLFEARVASGFPSEKASGIRRGADSHWPNEGRQICRVCMALAAKRPFLQLKLGLGGMQDRHYAQACSNPVRKM